MPRLTAHAVRRARRALVAMTFAAVVSLQASPALAKPTDDEEELPDARLMGYDTEVNIAGGTMGTYVLLGLVGVMAVGVTFKNARRSHLD